MPASHQKTITVTDVRAVPGDSGFLVDDGITAILFDTGFAFTGDAVAKNIQRVLGGGRSATSSCPTPIMTMPWARPTF